VEQGDTLKFFVIRLKVMHDLHRVKDVRIATTIKLAGVRIGCQNQYLAEKFTFSHNHLHWL
jgi:hypothetical protein